MSKPSPRSLLLGLALLVPAAHGQVPCPAFTGGFEGQDIYGYAYASAVHDDGTGPALYVGGAFVGAGTAMADNVARWDGTSWSALGLGVGDLQPGYVGVGALASFDDGAGPELYVGGNFLTAGGAPASRIAAWNGTSWRALGTGVNGAVAELFVWDDGTGPALYVGGAFTQAGGIPAGGIARWRNGSWSAVGLGFQQYGAPGTVNALASFDFGSGPRLVAGGSFTAADGAPASLVATWDGGAWSPLGSGLASLCCTTGVLALAVFDEGQGPRLFAAGSEGSATTHPYQPLARWDGSSWTAVTFVAQPYEFAIINALAVFDDGSGSALWCAGIFQQVPGFGLTNLARWDGTSWSLGAPPLGWYAYTLARYDDGLGGGTQTYLGGSYDLQAMAGPKRFGRLDATGWSALEPVRGAVEPVPRTSVVHDDGTGEKLYVGGTIAQAGSTAVSGVAAWDGSAWTPVGTAFSGWNSSFGVKTLVSLDAGAGRELYAGAHWYDGTVPLVWRWDGVQWVALPGHFAIGGDRFVDALAVYDDGNGPGLYAAGRFLTVDGVPCNRIARFDGASWHPLGSGLDDNVHALAVVDAGDGPSLYAGGLFDSAGGVPGTSKVARWDGTQWHALAGGIAGGASPVRVRALQAFDDGSGMALWVGGRFATAGGAPAGSIARWRAGAWSTFGSGASAEVLGFAAYDAGDGLGSRLVVCGRFDAIGGISAHRIAAWTGSVWRTLESGGREGADGDVTSLTAWRDGVVPGSALYLTGTFRRAGDHPSVHFARFAGCDQPGEIVCAGDGTGAACPCANPGASGHGCAGSIGSGARLRASGEPSLASDSLVLRGAGMPPTSTCLYFQGTALVAGGAGATFGDGLRCAGGTVIRLGFATNAGGESQLPASGGASVSALGAVASQGPRFYQVWYRDAAAYCTPATFNLTNALEIAWGA